MPGPGTKHPFPNLNIQPNSQLSFPWAFDERGHGSFSMSAGPDGVVLAAKMWINFEDLKTALTQLLGYSWRDNALNPYPNRLPRLVTGATNAAPIVITSANHEILTGTQVFVYGVRGPFDANGIVRATVVDADRFSLDGSNGVASAAYVAGTGEWRTSGSRLRRKLPWQHPLFNQLWVKRVAQVEGVRNVGNSTTNVDVLAKIIPADPLGNVGIGVNANTGPWSNYECAVLTLEFWRPPYAVRTDVDVVGPNGPQEWLRYTDREWQGAAQMLSRESTSFRWGFGAAADQPVIGGVGQKVQHSRLNRTWYQIPEAALFLPSQDVTPSGLPWNLLYMQTATTNPITGYVQWPGEPITSCVNSPIDGDVVDSPNLRFMGQYMGTLLYDGVTVKPQPLQLPAFLMKILGFAKDEPISQTQCDVSFQFDAFDPPRNPNEVFRGHNLMPFPADTLWRHVVSSNSVAGSSSNKKTTPFQYADLSDLFEIL